MKVADRREFFRRLRAVNPKPRTELEYETPFELLIAVILSAQATDVGVNKATARLFPAANSPQGLLDLGLEGLKQQMGFTDISWLKTDAPIIALVVALIVSLVAIGDGAVGRAFFPAHSRQTPLTSTSVSLILPNAFADRGSSMSLSSSL